MSPEPARPDLSVPGPSVDLSGTVAGFADGQVRFLEAFEDGIHPVCIATLRQGRFTAEAPEHNLNPVYIAVTETDGRWTALADPVVVTTEDITVTLTADARPAWTEGLGLDTPIHWESELRRGGP